MSLDWISNPICCHGKIVCAAINPIHVLLSLRTQIAFRAALLYNAWEAHACDGRQMSRDDIERMEDFEAKFTDTSLNEDSFRQLLEDFGDFLPRYLSTAPVDVPQRALDWTRTDANRVEVTGLRLSPLPHHPACGSAPGGSNQTNG